MQPPLSKSLVVAGAIVHDMGKVEELQFKPEGWEYTPRGRLVGHIFIGRDMVLNKAATIPDINPETVLRLEHIVISHQGIPEWGSPISPSTPEALLVHHADDLDAKFHELAAQLETDTPPETEFTDYRNPLRRRIFRGLQPDSSTGSSPS
jgi:3'-5' exoribonuclease